MFYGDLAQLVLKEWLKLYKRGPRLTVTVTLIGLVMAAFGIYFVDERDRARREGARVKTQDYSQQIESLDQTRQNLQALITFVDGQRRQLELSEQTLASIRSEQDRLKPLIEADRKAIDALFSAQEARNQIALNKERWVGFGLGVVSSLFASMAWAIAVYAARWRKSTSEQSGR